MRKTFKPYTAPEVGIYFWELRKPLLIASGFELEDELIDEEETDEAWAPEYEEWDFEDASSMSTY